MRLKITDYSERPDLCDAIQRYYTLLQMTFAANVFKIFETPTSQIMRLEAIQAVQIPGLPGGVPQLPGGMPQQVRPQAAEIEVGCPCGTRIKVQARFDPGAPLPADAIPFPTDNKIKCPACGTEHDLIEARRQLEGQFGRAII
jgi:hypothetical protein